jgi:hypothetical protein
LRLNIYQLLHLSLLLHKWCLGLPSQLGAICTTYSTLLSFSCSPAWQETTKQSLTAKSHSLDAYWSTGAVNSGMQCCILALVNALRVVHANPVVLLRCWFCCCCCCCWLGVPVQNRTGRPILLPRRIALASQSSHSITETTLLLLLPLLLLLLLLQAFLLSFMKMHWAIRCLLPRRHKPAARVRNKQQQQQGEDPRLILRAIQGCINYSVGLVRARVLLARQRLGLDVRCSVSRCHIRWLGLVAAQRVLTRWV